MSTTAAIVGISLAGVSLVITLMMAAAITRAQRKRVLRKQDETPEDRYRHAAQDLHRMRSDAIRDSDRKSKRQSDPPGSGA